MKLHCLIPILTLALFPAAQTQAATLLDMNFGAFNSGALDNPYESNTTFATGVQDFSGASVGLGYSVGDGTNTGGFDARSNAKLRYQPNNGANVDTLQKAIDNVYYLSFTIAPDTGFTLDLDGGTVSLVVDDYNGMDTVSLFSSVDGFTTASQVIETVSASDGTTTFNISGTQYSNLSSTVEFRIYGDGNGGSNTWIELDNVATDTLQVTGAVIPEPSTAGLLLAGGFVMLVGCKRKRQA